MLCFNLIKNPKPFSPYAHSPKPPFHQSSSLLSPLWLTNVFLGHYHHSRLSPLSRRHIHIRLSISCSLFTSVTMSLGHLFFNTVIAIFRQPPSLATILQGLFLFYLDDNSLGCHYCCVLLLLMKHCLALKLVLKSLQNEIYILHFCYVVYPWAFASDHELLHEQLPKIRPCRPCLYTYELVFYLLHFISLFFFCDVPETW